MSEAKTRIPSVRIKILKQLETFPSGMTCGEIAKRLNIRWSWCQDELINMENIGLIKKVSPPLKPGEIRKAPAPKFWMIAAKMKRCCIRRENWKTNSFGRTICTTCGGEVPIQTIQEKQQ